jgi:hypothetical protein
MGMGPWAQGDMIRDVQKVERARFRRLLQRELNGLLAGPAPSRSSLVAAFDRMKAGINPKPRKEKLKAERPSVERYCDHPGRGY